MIRKILNGIKRTYNQQYAERIERLIQNNYINIETEQCGNDYGGFSILSSSKSLPTPVKTVLTFGIGEDLSFSECIEEKFHPQILAFDPTPKSIKYVSSHWLFRNPNFSFHPFGLSNKNEITDFHLPVNPDYVSGSIQTHEGVTAESIKVEMKSLLTICHENNITQIDILKMDIEGSEFIVIPSIMKDYINFYQLCIETHERFFKDGSKRLFSIFKLLIKNGYKFISVKNNEYTLIKENSLLGRF